MHLIGILLGPVSLHAINLASHESGWLEKRGFPPCGPELAGRALVPLSPQERVCFQCPDGCMFLSIANFCKKQLTAKIQALSLYSWMGENVFTPLTMSCKFSLRLPVLTVRRGLFFHRPLNSGKGRSCLGRERIESRLGKPVRLDR